MMKLGGMVGKCNLCAGVGKIKEIDLPKPRIIEPVENVTEVVQRVGEAIPWTGTSTKPVEAKPIEPVQVPQPIETTIKVERKKALYKRKTG